MSIISISGKIGAGKDEVAKIIQRATNYHFEIRRFADNLKDIVCMLIGCTREQLEDREFKEKELGEEWWYTYGMKINGEERQDFLIPITEMDEDFKNNSSSVIVKLTPRMLLQQIGTDLFRNQLHPQVWVNSLMSEYKNFHTDKFSVRQGIVKPEYPNWIIPDVRFPNELKAVKDRGGITIRVNRPDFVENALTGEKFSVKVHRNEHPSETALDNAEFDYVIENSGSLLDLEEKVIEILKKEKLL